jgi:hypothetical protein
MNVMLWMRALLAVGTAGCIAAGCASPATKGAHPPAAPSWEDVGSAPSTLALDREVRYYRDSSGGTWDDRGRKVEPKADAGEPAPPKGEAK